MRWVEVYNAAEVSAVNWRLLGGGVFVAVACIVALWGIREQQTRAVEGDLFTTVAVRIVGYGVIGAVILIPCIIVLIGLADNYRLRRALASGSYTVVEGYVQHFVPGDAAGHRDETWSVYSSGITYHYRYRWSVRASGFHQSAGPVRRGLYVRIADVQGDIARLEVRTSAKEK